MRCSIFGPKAFSRRRAISLVRAAFSLSKLESACLPMPSTFAASLTVSPSGSITSRRTTPPTCGGFFIVMAENTSFNDSQPNQHRKLHLSQTERPPASSRSPCRSKNLLAHLLEGAAANQETTQPPADVLPHRWPRECRIFFPQDQRGDPAPTLLRRAALSPCV